MPCVLLGWRARPCSIASISRQTDFAAAGCSHRECAPAQQLADDAGTFGLEMKRLRAQIQVGDNADRQCTVRHGNRHVCILPRFPAASQFFGLLLPASSPCRRWQKRAAAKPAVAIFSCSRSARGPVAAQSWRRRHRHRPPMGVTAEAGRTEPHHRTAEGMMPIALSYANASRWISRMPCLSSLSLRSLLTEKADDRRTNALLRTERLPGPGATKTARCTNSCRHRQQFGDHRQLGSSVIRRQSVVSCRSAAVGPNSLVRKQLTADVTG